MPIINGTAQKQKFCQIKDSPDTPSPIDIVQIDAPNTCCFSLPALAQLVITDPLKTDYHFEAFLWNNAYTGAVMKLESFEGGVWVDKANLTDNTLGTFYDFGYYFTMHNENTMGFLIDWSLVLNAYGAGRYRLKCTGTQINASTVDRYSLDFCLEEYTPVRAERTVRISYWYNGNKGSIISDKDRRDYGSLDLFSQIRLPECVFGNDTSSEHEKTFVKYQNGKIIPIEDSQIEEYTLRTGLLPTALHRYLKINILQGGAVSITDYNADNPTPHSNKYVEWIGAYEPTYTEGVLKSFVELTFQQSYQNFNHKNC